MPVDTDAIRERIDMRWLIRNRYDIGPGGNIRCLNPDHEDKTPSMTVYKDGLYCHSCGDRLDVFDYLRREHGMSFLEAAAEAVKLAGVMPAPTPTRPRQKAETATLDCGTNALPKGIRKRHRQYMDATNRVPPAAIGRGFEFADLERVHLAEGPNGDAFFAILDPQGRYLNIKRRFADGHRKGGRYKYEIAGRGTPAWCSPGILTHDRILVIEGELNGMAAWLAAPHLGVMGIAGTNGCLHLSVLKGRAVFIYTDPDEPGEKAARAWRTAASKAGAEYVEVLKGWPDGDACDVAGRLSREALAQRLP